MRLHFQAKPWDVYAAVGYTVVLSAALLALNVGNFLAILLVLFVPGYVVVAALFPGSVAAEKSDIGWTERIALSFGLSFAVLPLLGLLLNFTPFGFRFVPIVVTIALFTVGIGTAACWRRMQLPADRRLSLTLAVTVPKWGEYNILDKALTIALTASIVVAGSALSSLILASRSAETFTEFYLLGPDGEVSGYPIVINISQPGSVILGLANHEATTVMYTVRVDLVGVQLVYNATSGFNETVELNRTTFSRFNVSLPDGKNWTQVYTFQIDQNGLWKVQFLLFKDGELSSAYRELHLYVTVA